MLDYDSLHQEVTEHKNYSTSEDHIITSGMEKREPWNKRMRQLLRDLSTFRALVNTHDSTCKDIDMSTLGDKLSCLQNSVSTTVKKH